MRVTTLLPICAALLLFARAEAADPPAPPAAMDVLDLGETAEHAASRMPAPAATEAKPKKQGEAPAHASAENVPDDVLRDRGFSAIQSVQQQVGFGTGNDVGREGRDVARDLHHEEKKHDPGPGGPGGPDQGDQGHNGHGHH